MGNWCKRKQIIGGALINLYKKCKLFQIGKFYGRLLMKKEILIELNRELVKNKMLKRENYKELSLLLGFI